MSAAPPWPVWLNGRLVAAETARIDPADRGLLLGDGLFETMLVRGGRLRLWERHRARLAAGAEGLGLPLPPDLDAAVAAVVGGAGEGDFVVRLTLTRGVGPRGVGPPEPCRPTLLITAVPTVPPATPARLVIARSTTRNERSPLSRLKTLNYLDSVIARREAAALEADDAVVLNTAGRVACATAATLFAVVDGRLLTPPLREGSLPGVIRAELLTARLAGEAPLTEADLAAASELFLTSALGVRGVVGLEGRELERGAATQVAQALFDQL